MATKTKAIEVKVDERLAEATAELAKQVTRAVRDVGEVPTRRAEHRRKRLLSARDEPLRMEDPSFSGWSQATPAGGATLHPHDADS